MADYEYIQAIQDELADHKKRIDKLEQHIEAILKMEADFQNLTFDEEED